MTLDQPSSQLQWRAPMLTALAENWWLLLLRGIAAIVFGVLAFIWPGVTLALLVLLYGAFALVDGAFALAAAIMGKAGIGPRWWLAIVGLLGIGAGVLTFLWPGITALVLLVFIAAWSIMSGIFQIIGAIQLRKEIDNEWLLVVAGLISVVFGILLLAWPASGLLALVWLIGAYAVLYGAVLVGLALRLRNHRAAAAPRATH
jgi:uncharacterized membrane protein HdeD (DUF308 family)